MPDAALPNLCIIGAMKCGTTSLNDYLACHPDIHMAAGKELNWFAGEQAHQPLDWYKAQFDARFPVRGEASQNYSKAHHPLYAGAPERMAALIPDARLIYLVRDPVERYRSHIAENRFDEPEQDMVWNLANDHQFNTGRYAWQLRFFLQHFRQDQILVVDSHDLRHHRLKTLNHIFDFLDVAAIDDANRFAFESNTNDSNGVPYRWRISLPYRIADKVLPVDIYALLSRPAISRRLFPELEKPKLSSAQVDELRDRYAPDVADLRALTGHAFASWQV